MQSSSYLMMIYWTEHDAYERHKMLYNSETGTSSQALSWKPNPVVLSGQRSHNIKELSIFYLLNHVLPLPPSASQTSLFSSPLQGVLKPHHLLLVFIITTHANPPPTMTQFERGWGGKWGPFWVPRGEMLPHSSLFQDELTLG